MANFYSDLKKFNPGIEKVSEENLKAVAEKKPEVKNGKEFKGLIKMKCALFDDEEIGVVLGNDGKFLKDKDGVGGTVSFFNTNIKIHYDGVIFFQKEIALMIEQELNDEQLKHLFYTKKKFGSSSFVVKNIGADND